MLTLNYIFPDGELVSLFKLFDPTDPFQIMWLDSMITPNPDVIFFFTVPTTDIGDEF